MLLLFLKDISQEQDLPRVSKGPAVLDWLSGPLKLRRILTACCSLFPPLSSSVPQHFCPFCQVPQTSASSTPTLVFRNVSGKSLWPEWLSPPKIYSPLLVFSQQNTSPQQKYIYWLQTLATTTILCLHCPFHCTRLYQSLRRGLIEPDLIFLLSVHYFAFRDCSPGLFHLVSIEDMFSSNHYTISYFFSWDFPTGPCTSFPLNSFLKKIQRNLCPKKKTKKSNNRSSNQTIPTKQNGEEPTQKNTMNSIQEHNS